MATESGKVPMDMIHFGAWEAQLLREISPQVAAAAERVSDEFARSFKRGLGKRKGRNKQKALDAQA